MTAFPKTGGSGLPVKIRMVSKARFEKLLFLVAVALWGSNAKPWKVSEALNNSPAVAVVRKTVDSVPPKMKTLMRHYPQIIRYRENKVYFSPNDFLVYDDGVPDKTFQQLLERPDLEDQFMFVYGKGAVLNKIEKNADPGRIRNEEFFKKIYGGTKEEVRKNLVEITWCPKLVNQKILVTKINGVDRKLKAVSDELDRQPELKPYVKNIAGTFTWRTISGTARLSMHSFGMTIDINTQFSNYWQWDCKCKNEETILAYKNRIPQKIVDAFEKYGFIWGGKWYHYDTMHFEYRPELLEK